MCSGSLAALCLVYQVDTPFGSAQKKLKRSKGVPKLTAGGRAKVFRQIMRLRSNPSALWNSLLCSGPRTESGKMGKPRAHLGHGAFASGSRFAWQTAHARVIRAQIFPTSSLCTEQGRSIDRTLFWKAFMWRAHRSRGLTRYALNE